LRLLRRVRRGNNLVCVDKGPVAVAVRYDHDHGHDHDQATSDI
jgi:hypothetical protein